MAKKIAKPMIKFIALLVAASAVLAANNSYALTTAEVVAKAKPCIVGIRMSNSAHPEAGGSAGTGFFIAKDRIMTAFHVGAGDWGQISVVDPSNNVIHVAPDPTYANGSQEVDLLILKVTDEVDHPYLSFAFQYSRGRPKRDCRRKSTRTQRHSFDRYRLGHPG